MGKKDNAASLRTAADVLSYAGRHGCQIEHGSRHYKVRGPGGDLVTVPYGSRLDPATLRRIVKYFVAWGIAAAAATYAAMRVLAALGLSPQQLLERILVPGLLR